MPKTKLPKSKDDDEKDKKPSKRVKGLSKQGRMAKAANEKKLKDIGGLIGPKRAMVHDSYGPGEVLKKLTGMGQKSTIMDDLEMEKRKGR